MTTTMNQSTGKENEISNAERELEEMREMTRRERERFDNQPDYGRLWYDTSKELA